MQIKGGRDFPALEAVSTRNGGFDAGPPAEWPPARGPYGKVGPGPRGYIGGRQLASRALSSPRNLRPCRLPDQRWCRVSRNATVSFVNLRPRFERMQPRTNYRYCRNAVQEPENTWKFCTPPGRRSGRRRKISMWQNTCRDPGARNAPILGPGRWLGFDPPGRRARPPQCWGGPTTMARMVSSPRALHASRR